MTCHTMKITPMRKICLCGHLSFYRNFERKVLWGSHRREFGVRHNSLRVRGITRTRNSTCTKKTLSDFPYACQIDTKFSRDPISDGVVQNLFELP